MKPIKVAHITTVDISLRYLLLEQMQYLQESGYEVAGISTPGSDVAHLQAEGIRHIPVTMSRNFTPVADLVSLWRLYRVMRRERFTIVHTHNPKPGLLGQLAARLARVPIVVNTLHGFYFHELMPPRTRAFYFLIERIAALCSSSILSQSLEDIGTALREKVCTAKKISHLGNGIDVTFFNPRRFTEEDLHRQRESLGLPREARVIGFVGRLAARRKGFLDFLKAGAEVLKTEPNTYLVIVGGSDRGKADAVEPSVAKDYGIWDRCRFLGTIPNRDLPPVYAIMDVLVLPSLFEGVPRALMEAAAMEIPMVATNVKGNREVVIPERNGLLVPLGDVEALARAIRRILREPALARGMKEEGRRIALERFDERVVFEKVRREYERLLREKGLAASGAMVSATSPMCL